MLSTIVAPELNPLLTVADHVDVKITEADVTLRVRLRCPGVAARLDEDALSRPGDVRAPAAPA